METSPLKLDGSYVESCMLHLIVVRSSASLPSAVAAAVQANGDIGRHGEGLRGGTCL